MPPGGCTGKLSWEGTCLQSSKVRLFGFFLPAGGPRENTGHRLPWVAGPAACGISESTEEGELGIFLDPQCFDLPIVWI